MENDKLRYERKFFISDFTGYEIESIIKIHPAAFSEIYYERIVNNIYLDSFDMRNYFDNMCGAEERVKIRIRWYGSFFGDAHSPVLELKTRQGLLCGKALFPLDDFIVRGKLSRDEIHDLFKRSHFSDRLKLDLSCMDIALFNSYRRKYYLSADKRYRITLDRGLEFYVSGGIGNNFLNKSVDHLNNILEVKYAKQYDREAARVTNYFPFRITKSSKYIMGLERMNLVKTYFL